MPKDLEFIAEFRSSAESALAGSRLSEEGIKTYVDGELMADWLWHLEAALGGVRMFVESDDADRARKILLQCRRSTKVIDDKSETSQHQWACVTCRTQVDSEFDVCWNCGTTADGQCDDEFEIQRITTTRTAKDEAPAPWLAMLASINPATFFIYAFSRLSVSGSIGTVYEDSGRIVDDGNDSTSSSDSDLPTTTLWEYEATDQTPIEEVNESESEVERFTKVALRASIIGIAILPFFLHIYSLWIISRHRLLTNDDNPIIIRAWGALFIDITVIALTCLFFIL